MASQYHEVIHNLEFEQVEQPDGAVWHYAQYDDATILLTSKGNELVKARPELEAKYVPAYIAKFLGNKALTGPDYVDTRNYIASGGTATVYELAPEVAVKEVRKTSASTPHVLERMDRLKNMIDTDVPRWIDIPDHYGAFMHRCFKFDFLPMEKIDSCITVDWLLRQDNLNDFQQASVTREFGEVSEGEQDMIGEAFTEAKELVSRAIEKSGQNPENYLVDYHEGNVIVERALTPIGGKHHKLWLIDQ